MTLRHLEVFLALARTPNMRDAAASLFISQAAVSSALRDFEAELGVPLFDRLSRGLQINEKGRLLEARLGPLYERLRDTLALVSEEALAGHLNVGASATLSESVLPPILYDMKLRHPHAEIVCRSGNTDHIVRAVEHGRLDLGFVEGEVHNLNVRVTPLAAEQLVIVSADAQLAQSPRHLADLMNHFWLLREPGSGTRECFLRQLAPRGLQPARFLELERSDAIRQLLAKPGTLACLSPRVVDRELAAGELFAVPVADAVFERHFTRVEHRDSSASPLRDALCEALETRLARPVDALPGSGHPEI